MSGSEFILQQVKLDAEALSRVVNSAAALSVYLASGCTLSSEEREVIRRGAALIMEATTSAIADAASMEPPKV
jgi:hypothetical protein